MPAAITSRPATIANTPRNDKQTPHIPPPQKAVEMIIQAHERCSPITPAIQPTMTAGMMTRTMISEPLNRAMEAMEPHENMAACTSSRAVRIKP